MEDIKGYIRYQVDMHFTSTGKAVSNFTLYDTEYGDFTWKLRVTTWEDLAEACNRELSEGTKVMCRGTRKTSYWTDKETGEMKSVPQFTANRVWELDGTENEMMTAIEITIDNPRHVQ